MLEGQHGTTGTMDFGRAQLAQWILAGSINCGSGGKRIVGLDRRLDDDESTKKILRTRKF